MNCRFCGMPLTHVFVDLGTAPPSNSFLTAEQLKVPEVFYPLKVFTCGSCFLVQVDEHKDAREIFNEDYVYFSSTSSSWLEHCKKYVESIIPRLGLTASSRVVEIASNDGYLLQYFQQRGIPCLGIEPTRSTAAAAKQKGIAVVEKFFGSALARDLSQNGWEADLIIGNNVLAHVPDLNDFVSGLRLLLKPAGAITLEFPHLLQLIENCQFDTIYHEHFSYFSLNTVCKVFQKHRLAVFDVEEIPTHGGSLRIYVRHDGASGSSSSKAVQLLLEREKEIGMCNLEYYGGFKEKVQRVKRSFLEFLLAAQKNGEIVAGYGAAAKGNTLLNYCGVRPDLVRFLADAAPSKQGKYLPGSRIPVVTEDSLRKERPAYVIVFPWNLVEEISRQLSYVGAWGGKLVTVIPTLRILTPEG